MHGKDNKYIQDCSLKPDRKRQFGRPRHRLKDSIKMDLNEKCYKDVDLTHLAQERHRVGALVNIITLGSIEHIIDLV
jgi:hypothetical protein